MVHQCQRHHLDDSVLHFILHFFFNQSIILLVTQRIVPAAVPADIPKAVQGQQVILAPGGGLGTMALSQVLLPGTTTIANAANRHPIYFTTQVLPSHLIDPSLFLIISTFLLLINMFPIVYDSGSSCPEYPSWPEPNEFGTKCPTGPDCSTHYTNPRYGNVLLKLVEVFVVVVVAY